MQTAPFTGADVIMVGAAGFEPAASWSRTKRAAKLRYAPRYRPCDCDYNIIERERQWVKAVVRVKAWCVIM